MASLEEMKQEYMENVASATHMLIIGPSKAGKSHYVAQAAKAGFDIVYFDNDNGLATLLGQLEGDAAAMNRVHYFNPVDFTAIMIAFLQTPKFQFNERTRDIYQPGTAKDTDMISVIYPTRLPRSVIVSFDSWSTLAFDALKDAAKVAGKVVTGIPKFDREMYGPAGFQIEQFAQLLQLAPFNFIVQGHPAVHEIKEKPPGFSNAREIKEADMIIKDTWDVVQSTSGPNGFKLGKYFNQIGWLELDRFDKYKLSFKPKAKRMVGGTPNSEGDPMTTHSYKNLFGKGIKLPGEMNPDRPWLERLPAGELKARLQATAKPVAAPATAPANKPTPIVTPATPPTLNPAPAGLKLGIKLGA